MLIVSAPAGFAGNQTADDIVARAHKSFSTAKNVEEIESIKMWCLANLASLSFPERNRLLSRSLDLMKENKIEEANDLIKRVHALEDLDKNLRKLACKPR